MTTTTRRAAATLAAAAALALGGCGLGPDLYDVPLPSKVTGDTYPLKATFESALNVPVASSVKLDGKVVGEITAVGTKDYVAHVEMAIMESTELPVGTRAEVRLTAPVGEAFIALERPDEATEGTLRAGDTIGLAGTDKAPDTIDLLSGVSAAVTGGSYADLKVVVDELVIAMDGSSDTARHLLREVDTLVTSTNAHRDDIDAALDGLDRLAAGLADDATTIAESLERLDPAIAALQEHEDEAVSLLAALDRVEASSRSTFEGLRGRLRAQLEDTSTLVEAVIAERDELGPLMDGVSGFAASLDRATPGDYALFDLTFNVLPAIPAADVVFPVLPDAATLLESDPAETVAGLQGTLSGLLDPLLGGLGGQGGEH